MRKTLQRGFVRSGILDLAFLFILILIGIGVWEWLSTLISGDFMLAWFMMWLMAAAAAWWWTRGEPLVLRIPTGFLLFIVLGAVLLPLSWWSGNKLAVATEAVVLAVGVKYLGARWAAWLKPRLSEGAPWYLDQSINLIDDLFRWVGYSILAWFVAGVLPLMLVFVLSVEWMPWGALVWAFGATTWFLIGLRRSRVRPLKLPLGLWMQAVTTVVLVLFQKQIAGPLEPGSVELIGYIAYWPVVVGLFVEIVVVGTPKQVLKPQADPT